MYCRLGCKLKCLAKVHGCGSECVAVPERDDRGMAGKVVIDNKKANMSPGDHIYRVHIGHEAGVAHVRIETIVRVYKDHVVVGDVSIGRSERDVRLDHAYTTPAAALLAYRITAIEYIRQAYEIINREKAIVDRELAALKSIDALIEGTTAIGLLKEN